jgi:ABC-type phosphate transport system substrate-binding protein
MRPLRFPLLQGPFVAAFVVAAAVLGAPGAALAAAASDEIVVVVSAGNPATEISRRHLADLYLGRTTRFANGEAAEPVDQRSGSKARDAFYERYIGRSAAEIKAHWSKIIFTGRGRPPREERDCTAVKRYVADHPGAIGYIERSRVDDSVRVVRVR